MARILSQKKKREGEGKEINKLKQRNGVRGTRKTKSIARKATGRTRGLGRKWGRKRFFSERGQGGMGQEEVRRPGAAE